jgi:hypothetical protein
MEAGITDHVWELKELTGRLAQALIYFAIADLSTLSHADFRISPSSFSVFAAGMWNLPTSRIGR